jgi:hypothetical protein
MKLAINSSPSLEPSAIERERDELSILSRDAEAEREAEADAEADADAEATVDADAELFEEALDDALDDLDICIYIVR